MEIAFIGLGIMGNRMAANLQRRVEPGDHITVFNRTPGRAASVVMLGAREAATAVEAVRNAEVVFTMLSTPEAVRATAEGDGSTDGFLSAMRPGALWVDCSTVDPDASRDFTALAKEKGLRFVEAPVAGTKGPAESGQVLFLAGGATEDVEMVKPLLLRMGRGVVHAGANGQGAALKLLFNLMLAANVAALSEALKLGKAMGLGDGLVLDSLLESHVIAPAMKSKKDKLLAQDYSPEFPLRWMRKDLHLMSLEGYRGNVPLPMVNAVKEACAAVVARGYGEDDITALMR